MPGGGVRGGVGGLERWVSVHFITHSVFQFFSILILNHPW